MKKKLSILIALVLVISLSLVPAVVSASPGIELNAVGTATAEISTASYHSQDNSVKLYVENGVVDWAEVSIPVDIALKDITELKFWERIDSYSPNGWKVQVNLGIDLNENGVFDADLPAWHFTSDSTAKTSALAGDSFVALEQPTGGSPATGSWVLVDSLSETKCWEPTWTVAYSPFADFLNALPGSSGIYEDSIVREVILQIGGSGMWVDEIAFVDDVTINGVTYDFEPTSSVGLTAAVPDIVAISANPTSIDFGTLYPGQTSAVFDITVENIGTQKVDVDASATSSTLFEENLMLKNEPKLWTDWGVGTSWSKIVEDLVMGASDVVKTKLTVPIAYIPSGTETATLIFEASPSS